MNDLTKIFDNTAETTGPGIGLRGTIVDQSLRRFTKLGWHCSVSRRIVSLLEDVETAKPIP